MSPVWEQFMASEKKPSIYVDRGTIGSSDELDEYGVWVKSEPQDLSPVGIKTPEKPETPEVSGVEAAGDLSDADDFDLGIPDIEDLPDFDTLEVEASKNAAPEDDFDLPDFAEHEESQDSGDASSGGMDALDFVNLEESSEDLNLPDFSETGDSTGAEDEKSEGFTEISMDDFLGNAETEIHESTHKEQAGIKAEAKSKQPEISRGEAASSGVQEHSASAPAHSPGETSTGEGSRSDLSNQLLMRIAEELASIRTELGSLKKEFSVLKTATAAPAEAGESGFFGEEDDEKIALTGDELNNILNTADFTEEAGADASVDLSEDLTTKEAGSIPDDTGASGSSLSFQEVDGKIRQDSEKEPSGDDTDLQLMDLDITLDQAELDNLETETLPDFAVEETEELKQIREHGAEPIAFAPAPEDAEYLVEDPLAQEALAEEPLIEDAVAEEPIAEEEPLVKEYLYTEDSGAAADAAAGAEDETFSGESLDLSEAVIDEPDLSMGIQDNPLEEPSLEDISISLDLSELESGEPDSETNLAGAAETENIAAEEEIELPLDTSALDSSDLHSVDLPAADETEDEEVPLSPDTENSEEGGDLSLIPEGFVVEPESETETGLEEADAETVPEEDLGILEIEPGEAEEVKPAESVPASAEARESSGAIPSRLKQELKTVLSYMDQLLEALPDEKIEEFAKSEYYDTYKKLFKELGLV